MNFACKLFSPSCLGLVSMARVRVQDGQARAGLRREPFDTMFYFTLGGAT
jgi:hypothetical protein